MDGLEMVESELEEGEAPLIMDYQNFDLDEAFSYMDKKVEDVLGQYRKEFEGGFSAETLGARYGGYGSFLPTYQRSPLCSQLKASSQAQNHSILKPSHLENSSVMSGGTPVKQELVSSCVPPLPLLSTSVDSSAKVLRPIEWASSHKTAKLPVTNFDQRNLKIRIKVGSDNSTLVKKNAEIYNNLGLDMSPSSSSEDGTPEWEGNCKDSQMREHESPSRIIKIMTSFPIPNGDLLSPLRDDLVHLVKDKKTVDSRSRLTQVRASVIMDEVASVKEVKGVLGEKNGKSGSKKWKTGDFKNECHADSPNACLAHSEKDSDSKTLTGKKTVSDGLKFLLKPSRRNKVGDTIDSAKASEAGMDGVKDQTISSSIEKEAIRSGFFQEASGKKIAETNLVGKVQKETKVRYSLTSGVGRNDMLTVGKRSESNLFEEDFGLHKANRDSSQTMDLPNRKSEQNRTSKLDSERKLQSGMKQPFSGAEKKLKENQSSFSARKSKEKGKVNPFAVPKDKSSCGSNPSKSKGDSRLHKDLRKGKYQNDLFGRIKLEKEESRNDSLGTPGKDNEKNLKLEVHDKEHVSYTIKAEKKSGDKVQQKEDPNNAHPPIGPLPANVAPAGNLIQENWVGCDRCEKWRLLPYGRNTKDLPKKWQCSMLDWLPGMNRCNISEDETTNAVHLLCQVPIPNIPSTQHVKPEINASSATLTSSESFDQNTKGRSQKAGTNIPNSARHTGSTCILNTVKKKSEDLVKRKSLLNASQSSLELKSEKASGLVRPLKMKCKREIDEYNATPLKKALTEVIMPYADEDGMVLKKETEVDNKQCTETSKYTRGMRKDGSVPVIGKADRQAQPPMKTEQHGELSTPGKKRKVKDWLSSQTNGVEETIEADCRKEKKASALKLKVIESNAWEEYSKPDKKRKVNRIVLSGNKGFLLEPKSSEKDRSLGNEDRNKRSQSEIDKQSSKKDSGKEQPYVAATSSSSMISSTCKVRFNIREVRGSPVGSVCSSPLRTPNPDNLARSLNNLPTECLVGCREQDNCIQAANNAVHEVKVLKHLRDASVSGLKSTVLFFEGALKFLQGASLIDPCNRDGARYGEMTAAELYSKAAKQCEYCALEYEKFQDMASASLAYKCMEVAYMRVIYSNDCTVSRDRDQLQLGMVAVSPAESPSSSASDVDNYQAMVGKIDRVKDTGSPQMTGNLVIAARSRSNFERLLNHVQHVNSAMEASRKSQIAFTAAKLLLEEGGNHEGVSSIRKVLDYSFHDVNELLALVRFAMDALKS